MIGIEYALTKKKFLIPYKVAGIIVFENEEGATQIKYKIFDDVINKKKLQVNKIELENEIKSVVDDLILIKSEDEENSLKSIYIRDRADGRLRGFQHVSDLKLKKTLFKPEWEEKIHDIY